MIIRNNTNISKDDIRRRIYDTRKLSLEAKCLINYILDTKDDDYNLSVHDLCVEHNATVNKIEKTIYELQQHGYIDYELVKYDSGLVSGKFTIYDVPHPITMIRYDYRQNFKNKVSKKEDMFIYKYLTPGRHQKRSFKISTLMQILRDEIVDWDKIYEYINTQMTYEEFLASEYWTIIAQYLKIKNKYTCQKCGKQFKHFKDLNIHHKTYEHHGLEHLEEIQNKDLLCCCKKCHRQEHILHLDLHSPDDPKVYDVD